MSEYIEANAPYSIDHIILSRKEKHVWLTEWGEKVLEGCEEQDAIESANDAVRNMP